LKGSSLKRQVLKHPQNQTVLCKYTVLKDLDFKNLEKTLDLDQNQSKILYERVVSATNLLKTCEIIDYSLLIFKLIPNSLSNSKTSHLHEEIKECEKERNPFLTKDYPKSVKIEEEKEKIDVNDLYYYKSEEENCGYGICIIDFLQTYTWRRYLEKKTKKLVHQVEEEAVGAQTPEFYAARIQLFLKSLLPNLNT
jgi:hypothetical protein